MPEYVRLHQSALDPADVEEVRRLFSSGVRDVYLACPGCLGIELTVNVAHNAGGLVEMEAISRWASLDEMSAALASSSVDEVLAPVRRLLRQEPVAKVLEVLA